MANSKEFDHIKEAMKKYLPKTEAPLVKQGIDIHTNVDADRPSLESFKNLGNKMQKNGMNLEK